ncbi:MAG: carbohydrate porin [Phycisphaerales bacterium]|nr:carbohydrate porin [Phycisphaerales bacterium]
MTSSLTLILTSVLLAQPANDVPPGGPTAPPAESAPSDAPEVADPSTAQAPADNPTEHPKEPTGKPDRNWGAESAYTVANTGLVGTQDRMNRPNPLFSPTVAQINLTPGDWSDWPWDCSGITGGWGGIRNELQDNGVFVDGFYVALLNENFSGGLETGGFSGGLWNASVTVDTHPLLGHADGLFFVNFQHWDWYSNTFDIAGGFDPTGSYTGTNGNLPNSAALNQISQLYYSQHLFDRSLNLAFGKQDANNIFSNMPGSGAFMYNAASFTPTLNAYMPTFPSEATALTAIVNVNEDICGSFGWFDGSLGGLNETRDALGRLIYNPAPNPGGRGPSTFFDNQGHWFLITEWGVNWQLGELDLPGALCAGGWLQTGRSRTSGTLEDGPGVQNVPGTYVSLSQTLWAPSQQFAKQGGGIMFFGQFGWSDPTKNAVHWSLTGGLSATGVIPGRPMDALGILGSWTGFSNDPGTWQSTTPTGGVGPTGGGEGAFEAFYRVQLTPWFAVQPGIQWLPTPGGGDPAQLDDAVTGYLMVEVVF